jgi:DNA repair protein RadC
MEKTLSNTRGIRSWPEEDRPREKLLKKGAGALSNSELLAILLRTGTNGTSAIDLARKVLEKFGTFRNMAQTDSRDWKEFKGLGSAKIAHIQAALEIGRRYRQDEVSIVKQKITSVKDVVYIVMPQMRDLKTELFKMVCLDSNNKIIDISDVACGTVNRAMPIVREIIHSALQKFAVSMICVHNHPSGDPKPSTEDRDFTRELCQAGNVMQVKILDHLIIGDNQYHSFADSGELVAYK